MITDIFADILGGLVVGWLIYTAIQLSNILDELKNIKNELKNN